MSSLKQLAKQLFQYEARLVLKRYKPKVIAITGSVGKTLTKDAIYQIISKKFFVRKSKRSFATELNVPLTIIGCRYGKGSIVEWTRNLLVGLGLLLWKSRYPDWLILEVDGEKPGDLTGLSDWFSPDILVITAIGDVPSHIETFGSDLEKFLGEKKSLVDSVERNGVIFYNADDTVIGRILTDSPARKVSCGISPGCDISASDFRVLSSTAKGGFVPTGMSFEITYSGKEYKVNIFSCLGSSIQYAFLLSFSVAVELGLSPEEIISSVSKINFPQGRMKILAGIKDSTIIDDSYNSSPSAVAQAIFAFSRIETTSRKIAVVGDMLELGKFSAEEHRKIGQALRDVANFVICVGVRSRRISEGLLSMEYPEESVICFDTPSEAGKFLQEMILPGDIILIKGSQAMRMERVVEEVMRHPEDREKLLVRQEREWLSRD